MVNKVKIEIEILNLMHIYATVSNLIKTNLDKSNEDGLNFLLLNRALDDLERQINLIYKEEHGEACAVEYEQLQKEFNGAK